MKINRILPVILSILLMGLMGSAQTQTAPITTQTAPTTTYQPKFKGDPARSNSEANALGYMRTFLRAERLYKKKNNRYATSLIDLVHTGTFTRRMASTDRGDYTVKFMAHKEKDTFELVMIPKQLDGTHRSFFSDQEGKIRADEQKEADEGSPVLKAD